jgi:hypothetical protein
VIPTSIFPQKPAPMKLTQLFCDVDDFCQSFILEWRKNQITSGEKKRNRPHRMSLSEMITLLVYYHQSGYRTFKWFYQNHVQKQRGVAIFAKAFMSIPPQQAAKVTRPLMPVAAPAVLLHSLDTQPGVSNIVLAMTRRDVGKPAFSLR